ncbi:MULE transposase domain-containing protein [Ditylenchus destructor]|uniref:MULE transposase domain-containing protein n=1 Tax=Ditylenchus destructor TaxID=166010 RepID=A0AAD4MQY7_9BILA|nr:MULE transposase domain-containing protein [Ditylenchus destructor]
MWKAVLAIYAIHHDLPDRSQATLSAFALMTAKDQASYTKMFEELSRKMHSLFGALENQKTWHFDHEMAAITACQIAFPIDRVVSCYFHFVKNCYSNAVDIGLKKRLAKNAEIRKWLRTLIGGVHLTKDHHAIMWDHLLQNPPLIPEQANLLRFVNYFRRQWHTDAARALINQHENRGPRTKNFSEGWNNTLRNKFGSKHPGLGEFIQAMKRELYSQSVLSELLLRGEPIRLRKPKYREAEQRLTEVRQGYVDFLGGEEIEPDAIRQNLFPIARRMAYYCATFVNRETLLENSNIYDPEQNEHSLDNEENEEMENNDQIDENPIENDLNDNRKFLAGGQKDFMRNNVTALVRPGCNMFLWEGANFTGRLEKSVNYKWHVDHRHYSSALCNCSVDDVELLQCELREEWEELNSCNFLRSDVGGLCSFTLKHSYIEDGDGVGRNVTITKNLTNLFADKMIGSFGEELMTSFLDDNSNDKLAHSIWVGAMTEIKLKQISSVEESYDGAKNICKNANGQLARFYTAELKNWIKRKPNCASH